MGGLNLLKSQDDFQTASDLKKIIHFDLLERKQIGETANMLDIVTAMQVTDKVINIYLIPNKVIFADTFLQNKIRHHRNRNRWYTAAALLLFLCYHF